LPGEDVPFAIRGRVVRVTPGGAGEGVLLAFKFVDLPPGVQRALAHLSTFEYEEVDGWRHVAVRGAITEATHLDALRPLLSGRVEIDLASLTYLNSWGTREWIRLVKRADLDELVFVRCAVSFVLAAGMTAEVIGPGRVASFYAPYTCADCEIEDLV